MLLRLGRFIINCPYMGVWRCEAGLGVWSGDQEINWDWKPEDCRDCAQCYTFLELPETRLKTN